MRVVFVCVENSNRSQMAEAFARMAGAESCSAGSHPSGEINPQAIEAMKELGYDLSKHRSKGFEDLPSGRFDAAITMGCDGEYPSLLANHHEDWQIPDAKEMPPEQFRKVRDLICKNVLALLSAG